MAKWQTVTVLSGTLQSDEIPIPYDDVVVPPGRVRGADGAHYRGADRIEYKVDPTAGGCRIVLNAPAPQDLVFKVRAEDEDDAA